MSVQLSTSAILLKLSEWCAMNELKSFLSMKIICEVIKTICDAYLKVYHVCEEWDLLNSLRVHFRTFRKKINIFFNFSSLKTSYKKKYLAHGSRDKHNVKK